MQDQDLLEPLKCALRQVHFHFVNIPLRWGNVSLPEFPHHCPPITRDKIILIFISLKKKMTNFCELEFFKSRETELILGWVNFPLTLNSESNEEKKNARYFVIRARSPPRSFHSLQSTSVDQSKSRPLHFYRFCNNIRVLVGARSEGDFQLFRVSILVELEVANKNIRYRFDQLAELAMTPIRGDTIVRTANFISGSILNFYFNLLKDLETRKNQTQRLDSAASFDRLVFS